MTLCVVPCVLCVVVVCDVFNVLVWRVRGLLCEIVWLSVVRLCDCVLLCVLCFVCVVLRDFVCNDLFGVLCLSICVLCVRVLLCDVVWCVRLCVRFRVCV